MRQYARWAVAQVLAAVAALPVERRSLPLVVLHERVSTTANAHQSLGSRKQSLCAQLAAEFNLIVIVCTKPGQRCQDTPPGVLMHLYPMDMQAAKLAHLHLLLELYHARVALRLRGVVGNTSGTLDLAALLGHSVLDLHNFQQLKTSTQSIGYQSYRLMIQTPWMFVCNIDCPDLENRVRNWMRLETEAQRLAGIATLLSNDAHLPAKYQGMGGLGFAIHVSEYLQQSHQWQRLPPRIIDTVLSATQECMTKQQFISADAGTQALWQLKGGCFDQFAEPTAETGLSASLSALSLSPSSLACSSSSPTSIAPPLPRCTRPSWLRTMPRWSN